MESLKERAIKLRNDGYSYTMIKEKLDIPKSTLSNWLGHIQFAPNQEVIDKIGSAKLKSALYKQKLKFASINKAGRHGQKDIGLLSQRDLFILGIGLYIGEGEKTYENVRIVNSDPDVIRLAMRWFYDACGVKLENIKPSIHLYPDNNIQESLAFWSKITGVPISQFGKTIIDIRKNKSRLKRRKLPHGTLRLSVRSMGIPHLGVYLHRRMMSWIKKCTSQVKI